MSESNLIRIKAFGARHFGSQLPRIELGLKELGAVLVEDDTSQPPDLVYANDEPRWQEAIDYRERLAPKAKLILTVLDVPEHNSNCDLSSLSLRLQRADAITTISPFVQGQVERTLGFNSTVIWNPIKDITNAERLAGVKKYPYRAMMVGRLRDPGKRAELAIRALIAAGFQENEVAVVGGEWPSWGTDMGAVSDEMLNSLYNSVDFVIVCSGFGGLELPILEAMAGGALPICCHDLTTFQDLGMPRRWGCHPSVYSLAHRLITLMNNPSFYREERKIAESIGQQVIREFSGRAIANRLLSVYELLTKPQQQPPPA